MTRDYSLVLHDDGLIVAHKPDCLEMRRLASEGRPVLHLFQTKKPLGDAYKRHSCCPRAQEEAEEKNEH